MKTHAFPIQLAKEAILLGKYNEALSIIKPLSDAQKDLDAQFLHAYLHFWDDDLDRISAIERMTRVAEQGHAEANYILAVCPDLSPAYQFNLPTNEKSKEFLQRAVNLGSDAAITDLAQCYLEGVGVEQDTIKARELLTEVFERGKGNRYYSKNCLLLGRILVEDNNENNDTREKFLVLVQCGEIDYDPFVVAALQFGIAAAKRQDIRDGNIDFDGLITRFEADLEKVTSKPISVWQGYLHHYCRTTLVYDLRDADFDAYCDFVFDHFPRLWRNRENFRWDRQAEVIFHSGQLVRFYTKLFENPAFLPDRYSVDQIIQGFGMQGIRGWATWTIGCAMRSADTTPDEEEACIRSMYGLFEHLFSRAEFDEIGFMWWDIGYGACGDRAPRIIRKDDEETRKRLYQATFDTMVRVLHLKSKDCQRAAIHGLGHRRHPDTEKVLRQYLEDNPNLPEYLKEYALGAIVGTNM